jgi:beta-glucanase (GH16 family)
MEIRARVPTGQGFWSSFFAVGEKWPPEIDVFENIGKDAFYLSTWTGDPAQLEQKVVPLPNMSKDYHTYAVDWQKDKLIWIFDGKEVFRTVESIPQTPLCLYLMFAVGGWPGAPDATTVLPAYYDIDYVRVWQRK